MKILEAQTDKIDVEKRTVPAVVNTDDIDSFHTIIDPSGGELERYLRNPVLGVEHENRFLPVGTAIELVRSPTEIRALFKFDTDEESDRVFQKYVSGTMRGFSVDILVRAAAWSWGPKESWEKVSANHRRALERGDVHGVIYKWELTRIDCVSVPSNPRALAINRSHNFTLQCLQDQMQTLGRAVMSVLPQTPPVVTAHRACELVEAAEPVAEPAAVAEPVVPASANEDRPEITPGASAEDAELERLLAEMTDEELQILATELAS